MRQESCFIRPKHRKEKIRKTEIRGKIIMHLMSQRGGTQQNGRKRKKKLLPAAFVTSWKAKIK